MGRTEGCDSRNPLIRTPRMSGAPGHGSAYEKALASTQQEPERQFLQERIQQLK